MATIVNTLKSYQRGLDLIAEDVQGRYKALVYVNKILTPVLGLSMIFTSVSVLEGACNEQLSSSDRKRLDRFLGEIIMDGFASQYNHLGWRNEYTPSSPSLSSEEIKRIIS